MRYLYALLAAACFAAALAGVQPEARATEDQHERDIDAMAGLCIHELTFEVERDCEPMYQVVRARQQRRGYETLERAVATQSRRYYRGTSNRPWARLIRPGRHRVPGWPDTWPSLRSYSADVDRVWEHVRGIVEGREPEHCDATPHRWGSLDPRLPDLANARRAIEAGRWREVDCGDAIQGYYAVVAWSS